jgi:hypothetical protein
VCAISIHIAIPIQADRRKENYLYTTDVTSPRKSERKKPIRRRSRPSSKSGVKIEELKAKAEKSQAELKIKYEKQIEDLHQAGRGTTETAAIQRIRRRYLGRTQNRHGEKSGRIKRFSGSCPSDFQGEGRRGDEDRVEEEKLRGKVESQLKEWRLK